MPNHDVASSITTATWADIHALNKMIRTLNFHASCGITLNKLHGPLRILAITDASYNRHTVQPSLYSGLFYLSDMGADFEFNQELYTANPSNCKRKDTVKLVNASLLSWKTRKIVRRVDSILDCETLAIQYSSNACEFLKGLAIEFGLMSASSKPIIYNDNMSTISHICATNRHNNDRLNVIWSALRQGYNENRFGLKFICGKTLNIADCLMKLRSPLADLFYRTLRLGKVLLPAKQ